MLRPESKTFDQIDVCSAVDKDRAISRNAGTREPLQACVHELFSAQATRTPEKTAIISWDATLNYAELDVMSSRLAGHLIGLGAGPETYVPFCIEKSTLAVVSMLAILK
jgi:non-ribosomal peptide synthetase component F